MNVIRFGENGMVGEGVLRECLLDADVRLVQTVGRTATGVQNPKLREVVHSDLMHYGSIEAELSGFDTCFFSLGVSVSGMAEADYERVTYGITLAAAETLSRLNPQMTFIFVSGAGTDSSERGRTVWARVKGKTENALLRLPFKGAYMFRPAFIQPLHGITSRTRSYRVLYAIFRPLVPLLKTLFPRHVTTTEQVGRAMLKVAKQGAAKPVLESEDIRALGA